MPTNLVVPSPVGEDINTIYENVYVPEFLMFNTVFSITHITLLLTHSLPTWILVSNSVILFFSEYSPNTQKSLFKILGF